MSSQPLFRSKNSPAIPLKPIQILPEALINKIAAGEVVERPASVVKELVENSLDAGATEIEVSLQEGGLEEIAVLDNGFGMQREDLLLATLRHATSKISSETDLSNIASFGFRGEALSAISAVSKFTLTTRCRSSEVAYCLSTDAATPPSLSEVGAPEGTEVRVKQLFFNIPARRKFLRSVTTEFGHAQETLIRLALIHPEAGFRLTHNGRNAFHVAAKTTLSGRIRELLDWQGELLKIGEDVMHPDAPQLQGFISPAHEVYGNREHFYLYVQKRFIRDRSLIHAITSAYREVAPSHSYPLVVLDLTLPLDAVDVNVHPAKAEVRFAKPQAIHDFVFHHLRKKLSEKISTLSQTGPEIDYQQRVQNVLHEGPQFNREFSLPGSFVQDSRPSLNRPIFSLGNFSRLRIIGQWNKSFILCEDPQSEKKELLLIDQHAAHERIGYERFKKSYKDGKLSSQTFLIPEQIEVSALEYGLLEEYQEALKKLAFALEGFGGNTVLIRAIPSLLSKTQIKPLLLQILQDLRLYGSSNALEDALDHVLMTFSCHTMIRANHPLEPAEMQALLGQLDEVDFSQKCPHGRPVCIAFTLEEIERRFLRT